MQRGPQSRVMVEGSALAARRLRPERPRVPTACQGGSERPCSGNGQCSGDGSRQGDGSCQCHVGYRGPLCTDCVDGYFSSLRNETHSICTGAAGGRGGLLPGAGVRRERPRLMAWGRSRFRSLSTPREDSGTFLPSTPSWSSVASRPRWSSSGLLCPRG